MARLGRVYFAFYAFHLMESEKNILQPSTRPLHVAVLVLDDSNTLSFAAAVDPLRAANRMAGRKLFAWQFVTADGTPARLTSGIDVPGTALRRLDRCDLLIVIAGFRLADHATPALRASLRRIAATGATLAGIDGGPWLLAEAGVLDGYRATTHWEDLESFASRFPAVTPLRDRFHIDRGRMTCGGAAPAIDMMMQLIARRCGAALAARVAGAFILDTISGSDRAQLRSGGSPAHSPLTARAHALMEQTLDEPLPLPELARRAGSSPRALQAQFRARLSTTPQAHYLALRLAEAHRRVTDTDQPVLDIALATGFSSDASFSRAFRAAFGQSARTLRKARTRPV